MIPIPSCSVITTPVDGKVRRLAAVDTLVRKGDVVATISSPRGDRELVAISAGTVGGGLADPTQPVVAGEGIIWLARR